MLNLIVFAIVLTACQSVASIAIMTWAFKKATDKELTKHIAKNSIEIAAELQEEFEL